MDTHLDARLNAPAPDTASWTQASLPGEGREPGHATAPGIAADPNGRPTPAAPARRRRRGRTILLGTTAVLLVAAVGGAFLLSPYNHLVPVDAARIEVQVRHLAAAAGIPVPPVVAPAASLATAPRPRAEPVYREAVKPTAPSEQVSEILGLHPGAPPRPSGAAQAAMGKVDGIGVASASGAGRTEGQPERASARAPAQDTTAPSAAAEIGTAPPARSPAPATTTPSPSTEMLGAEPGMTVAPTPPAPTPPASAATAALNPIAASAPDAERAPECQVAALPAAPAPTAAATVPRSTAPAPAPADPVATAIELRPAPMARGEQIEVLNLVAQLGIVVRDLRTENAALRARVQASVDKVEGAVADFERRLALAEARGAISAAMGVDAVVPAPAPAPGAAVQTVGLSSAQAPARTSSSPAPSPTAAPRRYRVTAASPDLAMLSELDRSGGEGSPLQVAVGDEVPGHGRIVAIQQQGAAWVVKTDRSTIQ